MLGQVTFYDVVLWVHITAVVTAFGALFAYPIFLAVNAKAPIAERAHLHRAQIAFSKRVTGPVIGVILIAGVYLASDHHLWSRAWVGIGLGLLVVVAGLGATVLRRGEERLLELAQTGQGDAYDDALGGVMRWTLVTVALVVLTVFLMSAKP
jgi:hypothetical protein